MLQPFKILTVTHRQTKLSNLERFVVSSDDQNPLSDQLQSIKDQLHLNELVYLATCNRVLYFFTTEHNLTDQFVEDFFRQVQPDQSILAAEVVALEGNDALSHLLDVAASVDSLVVGERQILGQLREAYQQCADWGLCGDDLRMAMQTAVAAAKVVYARTRIGEKSVSVASLAVQKVMKRGMDRSSRILLIGAGQTNTLVAKFLHKHHYENVVVFNRSLERAEQLAELFETPAKVEELAKLKDYKGGFDCMIVCTGAGRPIVDAALLESLLAGESMQEKMLIDLAIPQNFSKDIIEAQSHAYVGIDNLRQLAQENLAFREREVEKAREILEEHLDAFPRIFRERRVERAMRQLPKEVKAVKDRAINEVFRKEVATLDAETQALVERMLSYMEKKCIGIPMRVAREALID